MDNNIFTIMPMSQRFTLEPGKTYTGYITVVNPADATSDFNYKVSITPYGVVGTEYEADLVTTTNHTEITKWIKIPEPTGKVAPNGTKKVEFTITVPENAAAGGQYATISVGSNNAASQSSGVAVQNVFEMASIIYGEVTGETVRKGEILENNIPGFSAVSPLTVSALISNEGNIHENATFIIKVSNFFTGDVILPTEDNDGEYSELIMPESERYITREINNLPVLGAVKINQTIYYRGSSSTEEKVVILCPIWFLILAIFVFLGIIAVIVSLVMKHHKRKQLA